MQVVVRGHLLGYYPAPGEPHAGGAVTWRVSMGMRDLTWVATLAGGLGAETRIEWIFGSSEILDAEFPLQLVWSGPNAISGSVQLPVRQV